MITLDRDTRLEKVCEATLLAKAEASAQLVGSSISTTTPWLASALSSLRELQGTGEFEAGVGDLRVSVETADHVGRILGSIRLRWLPAPDVTRVSGGGVILRWAVADQEVEVAVLPRDRALLTILQAGEISESRPLAAAEYSRVNSVLKSLAGPS
jgi:hypothetical protein